MGAGRSAGRLVAVVAFSWMLGCELASQGSVSADPPPQLIIKFMDAVADPSRPEFVKTLSQDAGVGLVYLRPVSGGAHVFRVESGAPPPVLAEAIKRLAARRDIVYVEPDRLLRHQ